MVNFYFEFPDNSNQNSEKLKKCRLPIAKLIEMKKCLDKKNGYKEIIRDEKDKQHKKNKNPEILNYIGVLEQAEKQDEMKIREKIIDYFYEHAFKEIEYWLYNGKKLEEKDSNLFREKGGLSILEEYFLVKRLADSKENHIKLKAIFSSDQTFENFNRKIKNLENPLKKDLEYIKKNVAKDPSDFFQKIKEHLNDVKENYKKELQYHSEMSDLWAKFLILEHYICVFEKPKVIPKKIKTGGTLKIEPVKDNSEGKTKFILCYNDIENVILTVKDEKLNLLRDIIHCNFESFMNKGNSENNEEAPENGNDENEEDKKPAENCLKHSYMNSPNAKSIKAYEKFEKYCKRKENEIIEWIFSCSENEYQTFVDIKVKTLITENILNSLDRKVMLALKKIKLILFVFPINVTNSDFFKTDPSILYKKTKCISIKRKCQNEIIEFKIKDKTKVLETIKILNEDYNRYFELFQIMSFGTKISLLEKLKGYINEVLGRGQLKTIKWDAFREMFLPKHKRHSI